MGQDGVWRRLAASPAPAHLGYWRRFGNRFPWCVLVVGALTFVGFMIDPSNTHSDFAYSLGEAIGGGLLYGFPVGLLAAAFPSRK